MEDKEDYADELRKDFELRNIIINPKAGPTIDFILVVGIRIPGVPQVCAQFAQDFNLYYFDILDYLKDLCNTSKHDQEAYGHLHPSAFGDRFCTRLKDTAFIQSSAFTFFLLPIIKYRIGREVAKGWNGFVISGLESSLMATRAFTLKIAQPAAVICFRSGSSSLVDRTATERLFSNDELVDVPVGESLDATYGRLLAETVGKHGMRSLVS